MNQKYVYTEIIIHHRSVHRHIVHHNFLHVNNCKHVRNHQIFFISNIYKPVTYSIAIASNVPLSNHLLSLIA